MTKKDLGFNPKMCVREVKITVEVESSVHFCRTAEAVYPKLLDVITDMNAPVYQAFVE